MTQKEVAGNVTSELEQIIKERLARLRRQYRLDGKLEYRHRIAELELLKKKIKGRA